jgi:hypothetical protein
MNFAIASADPLKADSLGARLMGFEPEEIGYLYYLAMEGLGDMSLDNLVGDDWHGLVRKFKRHGVYDIQRQWR